MDFIDIEIYENLITIHQLNKQTYILNLDVNNFESRKKSNLYFLNIQQAMFNNLMMKKNKLLKNYYFKIIKNILNMHILQKKNKELAIQEKNNMESIYNLYKVLNSYSIEKYNTKKYINKLINRLNNLYNNNDMDLYFNNFPNETIISNDIILTLFKCKILKNLGSSNYPIRNYLILFSYFSIFNLDNDLNFIYENSKFIFKQFILKIKINLEFKEFLYSKKSLNKQITKFINCNDKSAIIKNKNNKQINLLHKKTKDIKNKFIFIQKDIATHEKKYNKSQLSMNKNIQELNIRIAFKKKILDETQIKINNLNNDLLLLNNIKGTKILGSHTCSICLENIDIGITTNCKHHYHHGCINLYIFNIIQSNTDLDFKCPLCRSFI